MEPIMHVKGNDITLKAPDITRMQQRDIDQNMGVRMLTNRRIVRVFVADTTTDTAVILVGTGVEREIFWERYSVDTKNDYWNIP